MRAACKKHFICIAMSAADLNDKKSGKHTMSNWNQRKRNQATEDYSTRFTEMNTSRAHSENAFIFRTCSSNGVNNYLGKQLALMDGLCTKM